MGPHNLSNADECGQDCIQALFERFVQAGQAGPLLLRCGFFLETQPRVLASGGLGLYMRRLGNPRQEMSCFGKTSTRQRIFALKWFVPTHGRFHELSTRCLKRFSSNHPQREKGQLTLVALLGLDRSGLCWSSLSEFP